MAAYAVNWPCLYFKAHWVVDVAKTFDSVCKEIAFPSFKVSKGLSSSVSTCETLPVSYSVLCDKMEVWSKIKKAKFHSSVDGSSTLLIATFRVLHSKWHSGNHKRPWLHVKDAMLLVIQKPSVLSFVGTNKIGETTLVWVCPSTSMASTRLISCFLNYIAFRAVL